VRLKPVRKWPSLVVEQTRGKFGHQGEGKKYGVTGQGEKNRHLKLIKEAG